MTLLNPQSDIIKVTMTPNTEMKMPARGPFSTFPRLRIVSVIADSKTVDTTFYPNSGSRPSTRHPETIRLINLDWSGMKIKVEYDSTSKLIKVLDANVESVTIEIK